MIDAIIDDGYIVAGKLDRNSVISKTSSHLLSNNFVCTELYTKGFVYLHIPINDDDYIVGTCVKFVYCSTFI